MRSSPPPPLLGDAPLDRCTAIATASTGGDTPHFLLRSSACLLLLFGHGFSFRFAALCGKLDHQTPSGARVFPPPFRSLRKKLAMQSRAHSARRQLRESLIASFGLFRRSAAAPARALHEWLDRGHEGLRVALAVYAYLQGGTGAVGIVAAARLLTAGIAAPFAANPSRAPPTSLAPDSSAPRLS